MAQILKRDDINESKQSLLYKFIILNKKKYIKVQTQRQKLEKKATVVPDKSDSDGILCLQLLSKTLTYTLNLS